MLKIFTKKNYLILGLILFISIINNSQAGQSDFKKDQHGFSQVRIISSNKIDQKTMLVGLHFKLQKGWKIYGKNINSFNQEPKISFSRPLSYKTIWPTPVTEIEELNNEIIKYNIYRDEIILPVIIQNPHPGLIEINLSYAICKKICIPMTAEFLYQLTINDFDDKNLALIENYLPNDSSKKYSIKNTNLFYILLMAFIGGFILNLMPCVFPVLSIKLLNLIKYTKYQPAQLRLIYFSTILGNVITFIFIAGFIALFKQIDHKLGWGLQFQNPYFLIFLCISMFYFSIYTLNGNIQISGNLLSKLNQKINQNQNRFFLPNFLSGILTVLLATPCSAPFLGSAISFSLSQGILEIFLIFITISFGLAIPYFALLIFPKLTYKFPKPGNWMNHVKKLMFLLLFGTLIWLLQILSNFIGWIGSSLILTLLILPIIFLKKSKRIITISFTITSLSLAFLMPLFFNNKSTIETEEYWIKFEKNSIPSLIAKDKIIIINITADWCLTCKVNEAMVLNSKEVLSIINQENFIAMRGDLTKPNQEILDFIKSHNRQGIPFTIIYSKQFPNGVLTSELIFKQDFLKLIKLNNKK